MDTAESSEEEASDAEGDEEGSEDEEDDEKGRDNDDETEDSKNDETGGGGKIEKAEGSGETQAISEEPTEVLGDEGEKVGKEREHEVDGEMQNILVLDDDTSMDDRTTRRNQEWLGDWMRYSLLSDLREMKWNPQRRRKEGMRFT